jgi:hypothetical protein
MYETYELSIGEEIKSVLDKVDSLRSLGLNKTIPLPQIAVMGDQSSGKSSVLESISKINFPRNSGLCTKFATEIIMRRSDTFNCNIDIKVNNCEKEINNKYTNFINNNKVNNIKDIEKVILNAVDILCENSDFSEDILSIQINGPEYEQLTIIDLPGYVKTVLDSQSRDIIDKIKKITDKYLKDERTIILAIIPSNVDIVNNEILENAYKVDPDGDRTIGVITKPDLVDKGTERDIIDLVNNKKKYLKLGYRILKNRSQNDINEKISREDTIIKEADFFNKEPWNTIDKKLLGVNSLKKYLSEILVNHINKELPNVKKQINELIEKYNKEYQNLEIPLTDISNKRIYFYESIDRLSEQIKKSLNGEYDSEFMLNDKNNRIRAKLYNESIIFLDNFNNLKEDIDEEILKHYILDFRGKELPGQINPKIFNIVFNEMCINWKETCHNYINNVINEVKKIIVVFLGEYIKNYKLKYYTFDKTENLFQDININVFKELNNILNDEKTPMTLNHYYFDNLLNSRIEKVKNFINDNTFKTQDKYSTNTFAKSDDELKKHISNDEQEIIELKDQLSAYYKVSKKRVIDNIYIQCVERNIVKKLENIKSIFLNIDDETLNILLYESNEIKNKRIFLEDNLRILKTSLNILKY